MNSSDSVGPFKIGALMLALLLFVGFLWFRYGRDGEARVETVPIPAGLTPPGAARAVTASAGPVKFVPGSPIKPAGPPPSARH